MRSLTHTHCGGIEAGSGRRVHCDGLCDLVAASATGLHGKRYVIRARLRVGVVGVLSCARLVVTKAPLIGGDLVARGSASELGSLALAHGGGIEAGSGQRVHGDGLRDLVGAMSVASGYRQSCLIGASGGVGVVGRLSCASLSISEVPLVAANALAARVGGGGAGELRGLALAYRGGVEAGSRLSIYHDGFCGGTVGLVAHGDGAGVSARHG